MMNTDCRRGSTALDHAAAAGEGGDDHAVVIRDALRSTTQSQNSKEHPNP